MSEGGKKSAGFTAVCISIPVLAVLLVLALLIYPTIMAKHERSEIVRGLYAAAEAEDVSCLVTAMGDFGLGVGDEGESFTEGEAAAQYARELADLLAAADYDGRSDEQMGSFDTRIRIEGGGDSITLYRTADVIYFMRGITRFDFKISE